MEQIGIQSLSNGVGVGDAFARIGLVTSLLFPADGLYRRALYELGGQNLFLQFLGPFGASAPPSNFFVMYALVYIAAMLLLAVWRFSRKEL